MWNLVLCCATVLFLTTRGANVTVISDTGAQLLVPDAFTFIDETVISAVDVNYGQVGTLAVIRGTALLGGGASVANVTLAWAPVLSIESFNDTYIVVRAGAPIDNTSVGDVVVTADTGAIAVLPNGWSYRDVGVIESVFPASGQEGTRVTFVGRRLRGSGSYVSRVLLGSIQASSIISQNDSMVVAVASPSAASVVAPTFVSSSLAIVTGSVTFEYLQPGVISSVSPATGQAGTSVTIVGQRLLGGGAFVSSMTLAGVAVMTVVSVTNTQIVVRAGAALPARRATLSLCPTRGLVCEPMARSSSTSAQAPLVSWFPSPDNSALVSRWLASACVEPAEMCRR